MRIFKPLLIFFVVTYSLPVSASKIQSTMTRTHCATLMGSGLLIPDLANRIRRFRNARIKRGRVRSLVVNNIEYKIIGILGEGSGVVYLGENPQGEQVVIKTLTPTEESFDFVYSVYYEKAVTQFYIESGLLVPRVFDIEIVQTHGLGVHGFVVKEYREGITAEELEEARSIPGNVRYRLEQERLREVEKVKKIHPNFSKWLKDKKIDLYEHPFRPLKNLIDWGDFTVFGYRNWLYDIESSRWIIFDP